ncbi:MAG: hypothetical protein AAF447_27600, partial [Myxococcota bacterium]
MTDHDPRRAFARAPSPRACAALLLALAGLTAIPAPAPAQTGARRRLTGEVRGLELQLEGSRSAVRGGTLDWALAVYEVVGLDVLRPAPGARVQLVTSYAPAAEPRILTVDGAGRGLLSLPVPEDAPDRFTVSLEVRRGGARRRFELPVQTVASRRLTVVAPPQTVPGASWPILGRFERVADDAPIGEASLTVRLRDAEGPLGAPRPVTTEADGSFVLALPVPRDATGQLVATVQGPEDARRNAPAAQVRAALSQGAGPGLLVGVAPERWVSAPQAPLRLDIVVRDPEGRPVPGARVRLGSQPLAPELPAAGAQRDAPNVVRTNARGRATLSARTPRISAPWFDHGFVVSVASAGFGSARGTARVRVTGQDWAARLAVGGGALAGSLGGHVGVEVVGTDGHPAPAGVPVALSGPRLGTLRGVTDAAGFAWIDVPSLRSVSDGDPCGGASSTAVRWTLGAGGARPISKCLASQNQLSQSVPSKSPMSGRR